MTTEPMFCASCEKPIIGKQWEIDGLIFCSNCKGKVVDKQIESNLTEKKFSEADVNILYPSDSAKLGRIVVSLGRQEKHLQRISRIITFFFVLFILNFIFTFIAILTIF